MIPLETMRKSLSLSKNSKSMISPTIRPSWEGSSKKSSSKKGKSNCYKPPEILESIGNAIFFMQPSTETSIPSH